MSPGYTLETTVSFLESALSAWGAPARPVEQESWTREELRKRYRKLLRVFSRLSAEQHRMSGVYSPRLVESAPADYCLGTDLVLTVEQSVAANKRPVRFFLQGSMAPETRFGPVVSDAYGSPFDIVATLRPAPFLADTQMTRLRTALWVGFDGMVSVFESAMDLWSRRHDIVAKSASTDRRPRRGRSIDRLFMALMRFVFGFFGTHKVDARNNP